MKVVLEDAGPCQRIIHLKMDSAMVLSDYESILAEYQKYATVPGFRPGKAPLHVIEKHFSSEIVEDLRDKLLRKHLGEILQEKNIKPVSIVNVSNATLSEKKELSFSVTVEFMPEFELPRYTRLSLKRRKVVVDDAEVDNAVQRIIKELTTICKPAGGRPATKNDMVLVEYEGRYEGKPLVELVPEFTEIAQGRNAVFFLSKDDSGVLPGFVNGLIGAREGETREIEVDFPADHRIKAVAGKKVMYTVKIKSVLETEVVPLTEEHLQKLGVRSVEELKQRVRTEIISAKQNEERQRLKNEIGKLLLEEATFDVPPAILRLEREKVARNVVGGLLRSGVSMEVLESKSQELREAIEKSALANARLLLILLRIAQEEKIEVAENEIKAHIEKLSIEYRMDPDRMKDFLNEHDEMMEEIKLDILVDKTLNYILDHAKIREE